MTRPILDQLKGGDLRSIGKADAVARSVLKDPELLKDIIRGMADSDPLIRMRASDVAEKVSRKYPEYIQPFKKRIIDLGARISQQEVRWHVALMIPRLTLDPSERGRAARMLFSWVRGDDKSRIVKVMSLQALADLAGQDGRLVKRLVALLRMTMKSGSPAMKARSRKLLKKFS